ncbi:MAG: hypothetical protein AUH85_15220 [Chloroflexi bacterium 13_1_40CM_4_68_4]|nr:MAG: hypothetical protein AUH85_15220 [Chloroflexi bacterium 13_1_40CM_4_68_4]
MSLIVSFSIAACVALLGAALFVRQSSAARSLWRVRVARGLASDGLQARLARLPLLRAWRPVDEHALRLAGLTHLAVTDLVVLKLGAAAIAFLVAIGLRLPPILVAPLAFAAFVAPSEWVARRVRTCEARYSNVSSRWGPPA